VVIVDPEGRITYGTPSLGHNLGLPTAGALGRRLVEFMAEADATEATAVLAGFAARTSATQVITDWRLRHRDGTTAAFEVLSHNLLDDPLVAGIVLTMRDVSERRALEVQLEHQGFHDALTGLPNRALLQDRAEHALARTSRLGTLVALLVLDLDGFQTINDAHGRAAADGLLVQVAARLRSTLLDGATVSRSGGDEFSILIEDLTGVAQAESVAARALRALDPPFVVDGATMRVGASVGLMVTGGTRDPLDVAELMRCATLALSAAKERGRGHVVVFTKDLRARMLERLTRRRDLERAIDADEFVLHFQPIVSIETGAIVSCEALVRWAHPTDGLLPPTDFVALTEETGLIVELGRWVLEQACEQLRRWADAGHPELRMSVNVSARQLDEIGFIEDVRGALRRHRVRPGRLVLELTESIFALDAAAVSEQLRTLRDLGVQIAMDDFGTGYSSLSYLQKFQMDVLKIDKAFVDPLGDGGTASGALVSAIIALAHALRLEVVAEGIERPEQRDALWAMGCALGQGFWYSRPVEAERMTELLAGTLHPAPTAP